MPLGVIADKCGKNPIFAAAGWGLVGIAYGLLYIPIAAAIVLGVGNALFHIGGGIDVLNISEEKMSALGVFVSPGAFGLYLGTLLGRGSSYAATPNLQLTAIPDLRFATMPDFQLTAAPNPQLTAAPAFRLATMPDFRLSGMLAVLLSALLAAVVVILITRKFNCGAYLENASFSLHSPLRRKSFLIAACFFFVVCIRSFMGLALNPQWKSTTAWGIVLVCAVVFGKAAGGFLSDLFGAGKIVLLSLGIAALLFFLIHIPIAGVAAIFLFNMTMPITLWYMAKVFPNAKGFSFGLLTFGLFIGFLPVYLGIEMPPAWVFALGAAISLVLLWLGLVKERQL
jgi:FSR family fosmidomycin resistance protein-like MFS transporter